MHRKKLQPSVGLAALVATVATVAAVATACLVQGALPRPAAAQSFDKKKAQREIEIMSGILQTTIKYATQEVLVLGSRPRGWNATAVDGYYLFDQGVTFVVSVPPLVASVSGSDSAAAFGALVEAERLQAELAAKRQAARDEARAQESVRKWTEEASRRREEAEEKMKRKQEDLRKVMEASQERLAVLKDDLLEALAKHGDSLTFLPDDEYFNLVLSLDSPLTIWGSGAYLLRDAELKGAALSNEVLSIRKSWVRQYKNGSLTFNELKGKVVQY